MAVARRPVGELDPGQIRVGDEAVRGRTYRIQLGDRSWRGTAIGETADDIIFRTHPDDIGLAGGLAEVHLRRDWYEILREIPEEVPPVGGRNRRRKTRKSRRRVSRRRR